MSENKIFCILGKFASGKTTIAKLLQEKYGVKRVITCTTRQMREGEREGVDYYFLCDDEFEKLASKGRLAAINRVPEEVKKGEKSLFNIVKNVLGKKNGEKYSKKYGVPVDKIDLSKNSYICVIEPSGYDDLLLRLGADRVKSIYLDLDDKERWLRALNREVKPNVNDIVDKHLEERNLYDGFEIKCDKLINNIGTSDKAVLEILEYINSFK